MPDTIPYESTIEDILIVNFAGSRQLSIMPQMIECSFYESIMNPLQKATLLLYDAISLFNNFPMIGEEIFLIKVKSTGSNSTNTFAFVVDEIEDIKPSDKNREATISLRLSSLSTLINARQSVMHAYNGKISNIMEQMFDQYISQQLIRLAGKSGGIAFALAESNRRDTKLVKVEESLEGDESTICIPNIRPIQAAQWLAKRCVPQEYTTNYLYCFFQSNDGFKFQTVQDMIKGSSSSDVYKYYSDSALVKNLSADEQKRAMTNLYINNRIKTIEKISSGYFENTLMEINMQQLRYKTTDTSLAEDYLTSMEGKQYHNTAQYMDAMKVDNELNGDLESKNRVKYVFNNRMENDPITPLTNVELKWGNEVRSETAFSSVDISVTVYGDTNLHAGDVINIDIPRLEGFNQGDGNESDKLLKGKYIITDVKHQYVLATHGSTVLRLNKDDYTVPPDSVQYNYGNAGSSISGNIGAAS